MRKRVLATAVVALTGMLTTLPATLPANAVAAGQGAPGVGDPYYPDYGNGGYDVAHYDLRLKYQPADDHLEGTATITATATQDLTRFNLDFALTVGEVLVNSRKATFARTGAHELEITPSQPLRRNQPVTIVVRYSGTPSQVTVNGYNPWLRTPDGGVAAGEPEAAWWWFPSNDHPSDKATYDVSVLVPDGTQVVSNGTLQSTLSRLGWTRYNWRSAKPQATYLATLAVGKFEIVTDTTESGLPVFNAYSRDLGADEGAAKASVGRTAEIVDWENGVFGPYPFEAIGGYVPNVPTGYALETQTRPFYSPRHFRNGANPYVVVHEQAHQWFGDDVSVKTWRDIWLNEGFARYAEWLWSEKEGEGTAAELAAYTYSLYPSGDPFWQVKPGDPGAENQFHGAVYNRGAVALQALRAEVGDQAFFTILKGWPTVYKYGNARIEDFISYAERVSGKQLGALFQTWLFTPSKPASAPQASNARSAAPTGAIQEPKSWKKIQREGLSDHAPR
ncbi:M1 family metallopeptidase [Streptosporangium sp. NPDC051023]|uniref:M1 family metallopeptidase n=1 Tax=Streptosporangium sp. NPDC051023 TaxID=3155410 RepID=UPI003450AF5D